MTVLPRGGGRPFLGGGAQVKVESGAADFSVFEQQLPPGPSPVPLHVHDRYDEAFYVLDGEMHFVVGDTTSVAEAGAFVFVPRGEAHRFWNASPTPSTDAGDRKPAGPGPSRGTRPHAQVDATRRRGHRSTRAGRRSPRNLQITSAQLSHNFRLLEERTFSQVRVPLVYNHLVLLLGGQSLGVHVSS